GNALVGCARHAVNPCDLTRALAKVADEQCRSAIECQVRALFAPVGTGSTACVQRLFRDSDVYMSRKARRVRTGKVDRIPDDLARCKEHAGIRCIDPITPPLSGACANKTTPTDGAACMCDGGDTISNRLLLKPPTCIQQAPQPCNVTVSPAPKP